MALWETPSGMPPDLLLPLHPGDSRIHSIATLKYGISKGDFTPEHVPDYVEVKITVFGQALEQVVMVLGLGDHPGPLGSRIMPPPQQRTPYLTRPTPEMEAG